MEVSPLLIHPDILCTLEESLLVPLTQGFQWRSRKYLSVVFVNNSLCNVLITLLPHAGSKKWSVTVSL